HVFGFISTFPQFPIKRRRLLQILGVRIFCDQNVHCGTLREQKILTTTKMGRYTSFYIFLIWRKSNSTGVSLPNIFTKTLSFPRALSTSLTFPSKSLNGPSTIDTSS